MAQTELSRRIEAKQKCAICGTARDEHKGSGRVHEFTLIENDLREAKPERDSRPETRQIIAVDIALRLALTEAGVIDAETILAAERKLGLSAGMDVSGQPATKAPAGGE